MKAIADTGFLVAFLSADDSHHKWAREIGRRVKEPLLTCEAVLAETTFHLQDASAVIGLVREGLVRVAFDFNHEEDALMVLAHKYADRKPDFADLCLVRMSEVHPDHSIVTIDVRDFRVYRRNKRDVISLIHPPGL